MTTLLASLLLLIPTLASESLLEEQIERFIDRSESGEYRSEALWSLIQIYRENEEYRERLLRIGERKGADWLTELNSQPETEALHELALHFGDEHLLLYLQLQIYPSEERWTRVAEFYEHHDPGQIADMNRAIATTGGIRPEQVLKDSWDFSTFLLLYYSSRIEVQEEELFGLLEEALNSISELISDENGVGRDYFVASLFRIHYRQDRYTDIARYDDELIRIRELPFTSTLQSLYMALDFSLYRAGHIDRSLDVQRQHTLPLSELMDNPEVRNQILATHGGYLYTIGRFEEARLAFTTALADSSRNPPSIQTRLLNNLGLVHFKMGKVDRYIESQMRALDFAVEQQNYSHQLSIYRNLHIYYRKNQNWDLAQRYIEEARAIAEESGNREELTSILISMAVYNSQFLDNIQQAYRLLEEAEEYLENGGTYLLKARILTERADLYREDGRYVDSRRMLEKVQTLGAENSDDRMYLGALGDLASLELLDGNLERTAVLLRELNAHDLSLIDFPELVDIRRVEAELTFRQGDSRQAEELLNRLLEPVMERARATTDIESGYWNIEPAYLKLFRFYSELLADARRHADLANLLDQLKTINDAALIDNPLIQAGRLSEEDLTRNRQLTDRLDRLRRQYLAADEETRFTLQQEIASLTAQRNRITRSTSDDLFQPVHIGSIQSGLRGDQMILHITRVMDRLHLLKIDRKQIIRTTLTISDSEERRFERAVSGLAGNEVDLVELHEIYQYLQLDRIPDRIRSLIVIPDSYLYQLPLDVLPVNPPDSPISYGASDYLIEKMDIRYANTLQDLTRRYPNRSYDYTFTGIGISQFDHAEPQQLLPLPGAVEEVNRIVRQFESAGAARSLTEDQGTPSRFRESASNSQILHFASHSRISESDPLFSQLWLAPERERSDRSEPGQNGLIYAWQLFEISLNNELIMLNSCDSGSGEFFQGTGIMGFSRALRYAGARSLVLNSWAVNDQHASTFATEFYRHLEQGKSKPGALREAKAHFISSVNANPHYWGTYILNGDSSPLFRAGPPPRLTLFFLVLLGVLALAAEIRTFSGRQ